MDQNIQDKNQVIVLSGPTASGKTALAGKLIEHFPLEIISADSRQVYKGLDIGTGKDTTIPQHMLDVVNPGESFSVDQYRKMAERIMEDIWKRRKIPLVVGGSGYYIEALLYQRTANQTAPRPELRAKLERLSAVEALAELKTKDPATAAHLDPHNRRRILRALEIVIVTNKPREPLQRALKPNLETSWYVLDVPRADLYHAIDQRVDDRLRGGMVKEVQGLLEYKVFPEWLLKLGLEYRFVTLYLQGKISYDEMVPRLKYAIHAYSRRQQTFFRRWPEAEWADASTITSQVAQILKDHHV